MKIYFAGNLAQRERILDTKERVNSRLLSFYFIKMKKFLVHWEFKKYKAG